MSFSEAAATEPGRLRIAISTKPTVRFVGLVREQRAAVESVAATLRGLGHEVGEADPAYPDLTPAFVPQYLGGVAFEAGMVEHPERLERRTKQTAAVGRLFPRAAFEWAVRRGERQAAEVNRFFDDWDLLLTPTIAVQPRPLGALDGVGFAGASLRSQPMVAYCAAWNVFGNPAASIPAGTSSKGLPLAVQLVGPPNDEPTILQAAAQLERELGWPERRPPVI
jgi:amidase